MAREYEMVGPAAGYRRRPTVIAIPVVGRHEEMLAQNPGRLSDHVPDAKPDADETPYRSQFFVLARHSADGNDYVPGDPIPLVEAVRQGLVEEKLGKGKFLPHPVTCPRCKGRKTARNMKGHKKGCACPGCKPCPKCKGKGVILDGHKEEGSRRKVG